MFRCRSPVQYYPAFGPTLWEALPASRAFLATAEEGLENTLFLATKNSLSLITMI